MSKRGSIRTGLAHPERSPFSFMGLIASQKFVSKLQHKAKPQLEPTYQLEPLVKPNLASALTLIEDLMQAELNGFTYDPETARVKANILTDKLKTAMRTDGGVIGNRYRVIVLVTIVENKNQGTHIASRCLWTGNDSHVNVSQKGETFACTTTAYYVYKE